MSDPCVLVVAKVPETGRVKTRLGKTVGAEHAAHLAHAALMDTLRVCESVFAPGRRLVALAGAVDDGVLPDALRAALRGWRVLPQVGSGLGERLAAAHRMAHALVGGPVVQIGMDTPHVTPRHLEQVIAAARTGRPVLGRAHDGGWWVLASTCPADVAGLHEVAMSQPDTWAATLASVARSAGVVLPAAELGDVDTAADAALAAAAAPDTAFAELWSSRSRPAHVRGVLS